MLVVGEWVVRAGGRVGGRVGGAGGRLGGWVGGWVGVVHGWEVPFSAPFIGQLAFHSPLPQGISSDCTRSPNVGSFWPNAGPVSHPKEALGFLEMRYGEGEV